MRNDEIYYVALDESGAATEMVLAEGNFLALQADLPERFETTVFKQIEHAKPTLDANQHADYAGWSQKEDGSISCDWDVVTYSQDEMLNLLIRRERDLRLFASDWTQLADSPLSAEDKGAWGEYRQTLRDMTSTHPEVSVPAEVTWPSAPDEPAYTEPES
jgi:hypothetical protein